MWSRPPTTEILDLMRFGKPTVYAKIMKKTVVNRYICIYWYNMHMYIYIYINGYTWIWARGIFNNFQRLALPGMIPHQTAIPPRPHQEKEKTGSESKETSQADVSSRKWRESTACCGCSLQKRSLDNGNIMGKPSINGDLMGFTGEMENGWTWCIWNSYVK